MKLLYLINSRQFNYHKDIIRDFTAVIPGDIIDMGDGTNLGERYREIAGYAPDVVITLDLAGFELRTGNDTLSLNNIYGKMAHILFHKTNFYGACLKARQNLSMFTYIPEGEDVKACMERYREIPNISGFVHITYKTDNEALHGENRTNIKNWWGIFKEDAML